MTSIAVTGCHGFVGSALVRFLRERGAEVVGIPHRMLAAEHRADLVASLAACETVIHCAGLTPRRNRSLSEVDYDVANHQMTRNLADAAAAAPVRRFVFVSSIAVISGHQGVLSRELPANPIGAYGRSKAKAEASLLEPRPFQTVIVRPPLVYGPGAKGDLQALVKLCRSPWPLPFGAVENRRSMVGIINLVDALFFLSRVPLAAATQIHHVGDAESISLRRLLASIRVGLGKRPNLIPIPPAALRAGLRMTGLRAIEHKLLDDLIVDCRELFALGWQPPEPPETDLHRMAQARQDA